MSERVVHHRECLILEKEPHHAGFCPLTDEDLIRWETAHSLARIVERDVQYALDRERHWIVERVRKRAYAIGGDSPTDDHWGKAALEILENDWLPKT